MNKPRLMAVNENGDTFKKLVNIYVLSSWKMAKQYTMLFLTEILKYNIMNQARQRT